MSSWTIFQNISILNAIGREACSCPHRNNRSRSPGADPLTVHSSCRHGSFPERWCILSPRNEPFALCPYPGRLRSCYTFFQKTQVLPTSLLVFQSGGRIPPVSSRSILDASWFPPKWDLAVISGPTRPPVSLTVQPLGTITSA